MVAGLTEQIDDSVTVLPEANSVAGTITDAQTALRIIKTWLAYLSGRERYVHQLEARSDDFKRKLRKLIAYILEVVKFRWSIKIYLAPYSPSEKVHVHKAYIGV